jgi:hypothetical protein
LAEALGTSILVRDFKRARNASVPLVAIDTVDQQAVVKVLASNAAHAAMKKDARVPIFAWDAVRGMRGYDKFSDDALKRSDIKTVTTINFTEAVVQAERLPADSVIFFFNAHRQLTEPQPIQAVANLRDIFKTGALRMAVFLAPRWTLPEELKPDFISLSDPLPDRALLADIVTQQYKNSDLPEPKSEALEKGIDSMQGLGAFETEQNAAMSMTKGGLHLPTAWDRKCRAVATASEGGLRIGQTPVRFSDMGGTENFKDFGRSLIDARWYSLVWFIDEIEKDMAAMHSDTSGTSQYQHKSILTFTQKYKVPAVLLIGQPGSGKTLGAHALAGEAEVPLAEMNLGGLKGKHVGDTEGNTDRALQTLLAISQGKLLLVATCNDVGALAKSPELLRRFKLPKFYFDLPTADERDVIWNISGARYGLDTSAKNRPDDTDWTGSEIDSVCEIATKLKVSLKKAATWIIPMAQSSRELVAKRRAEADGNYLSASYPGTYFKEKQPEPVGAGSGRRKINLDHES